MGKLTERIDALEKRALEIEGDSDSPLRVAAANKYWDRAERLRARSQNTPDSRGDG